MTTANVDTGLAGPVVSQIQTNAASDAELTSVVSPERSLWAHVIDNQLVEWGKDPDALADDGLVPPSKAIIHSACRLAMYLRDKGWPGPLRVVPDGEGGITFERRADTCFETLTLHADSTIELLTFVNYELESRIKLA